MDDAKVRNMEEFAAVCGISRPTLSKYFQDPGSVRASTRERIEAALERHDFRPNLYAVNQNRRHSKAIGIVVPYLADPFFAELARNIETLVIDARFRPILLTTVTTFLGVAPITFEQSLQAQFLIPMAASLGFGIVFATGVLM
ncbi:MAG: LacI family DNA-binding transcriptional regulator, partial [Pseudomonadota bacterium]